jgi:hypothetical protein
MIDKFFRLTVRDGKDHQKVEFDYEMGDLLHRVDLAIELLQRFREGVIEDELHKPFYMVIVPEDLRKNNRHYGETGYKNPLNDPMFGVSIELAADDDEPDIPF